MKTIDIDETFNLVMPKVENILLIFIFHKENKLGKLLVNTQTFLKSLFRAQYFTLIIMWHSSFQNLLIYTHYQLINQSMNHYIIWLID